MPILVTTENRTMKSIQITMDHSAMTIAMAVTDSY